MSEVKTAKQLALETLKQIEDMNVLTDGMAENLNRLTVVQAYPNLQEEIKDAGFSFDVATPRYSHSVDACLGLPRLSNTWWELTGNSNNPDRPLDYECCAIIRLHGTPQYSWSLPLAMLKAWWMAQHP